MISTDRFIVRSSERDLWLAARSRGVTATMVAKAFTAAGMRDVVAQFEDPKPVIVNAYMQWGNDREPHIASVVKDRFGIMPNDWLISYDSGLRSWQMATPDGLSLDHKWIGEYKTTGKPLDTIPANYMRQMQWQLYVTNAERCLFAYELRIENGDNFFPGMDVECQWVDRDEKLIKQLINVAEQLQTQFIYKEWDEMEMLQSEWGEQSPDRKEK